MDQQQRLVALKRVPILAALSQTHLEHVVKACKWQHYDAGEEILSYHAPSTEVFFLAAGKVRVIIYSAEGKAVVFTDLKAGAMFGEIAAIDRAPRSAGAEAIEPCTVAFLTANRFEALLLSTQRWRLATLRHRHRRGAAAVRARARVQHARGSEPNTRRAASFGSRFGPT